MMDINIKTSDNCKIIILDNSEYIPENSTKTVKGNFKYSETFAIDLLLLNKVNGEIIKSVTYNPHTGEDIEIPVTFDGWFTVNHIVIPTKEWFNSELAKNETSALKLYSIVYYTDGSKIYKYVDNKSIETSIDELLEVNPENTTISKTQKDYVSICFLKKCYVNLCLLIFESRGFSSCSDNNNIDSELIYKRDLLWMAINVIEYLTKCELLAEVERIIEKIKGCNGLCNPNKITSKTSGCGCSK